MIKVTINGKKTEISEDITPQDLLDERKIKKGAVWINGEQLLKSNYSDTAFKEGDSIKVLRLLAGG